LYIFKINSSDSRGGNVASGTLYYVLLQFLVDRMKALGGVDPSLVPMGLICHANWL
jgi:hypothetical protein